MSHRRSSLPLLLLLVSGVSCDERRGEAAGAGPCASIVAAQKKLVTSLPSACKSAADCVCYGGGSPATDCGGYASRTVAARLDALNARYDKSRCRPTLSCAPSQCTPACVRGSCQARGAPPRGERQGRADSGATGAADATDPRGKPYPQRWVDEAHRKHRLGCYRLVYKRGCAEVRKGVVTVAVTLREDGRVAKVTPHKNTIGVDPALVMRCVLRELAAWRFAPPRGFAPRFEMVFRFADRC